MTSALNVFSLFSGIGGAECGLHIAGHRAIGFCEICPSANAILRRQFPDAELWHTDIRNLTRLPPVDVVTAGFPCTDLSVMGKRRGVHGPDSGLVRECLRLIAQSPKPRWVIFENVPFMLQLDQGEAIRVIITALENANYIWAYRVVNTLTWLPQHRRRVFIVASPSCDPRFLFAGNYAYNPPADPSHYGFYPNEGRVSIGWIPNASPTLKGVGYLGLHKSPAQWSPAKNTYTYPSVNDAEMLQGFPVGWTEGLSDADRFNALGNAISVPVMQWIGEMLCDPPCGEGSPSRKLSASDPWPSSAWGREGERFAVETTEFPVEPPRHEVVFGGDEVTQRALQGFRRRTLKSRVRFHPGFLDAVDDYLRALRVAAIYGG